MELYYKFFDHDFLSDLDGKKNRELWATYHFLINDGANISNPDAFDVNPSEPADVVWAYRKFQIVTGSQDQDAVVNILEKKNVAQKGNTSGRWLRLSNGARARVYETTSNLGDSLDKDILRPIRNKIDKYGKNGRALNDVTLIIFSFSIPVAPYEETLWWNFLEQNKHLFESSGFREIYWSDQKQNILVYKNVD